MTTTDTDALRERIARALDPDARDLTMDHPYLWEAAMADAAAVLPIVAEEVRKAKAEAWDEGYGKGSSPYPFVQHNPYREQED